MDELAQCAESGAEAIDEILHAFKKVMYNGKYIFHDEEDEHMSRVVFRMIKGNLLSKQDIVKWLDGLSECARQTDRAQYVARVNAKNFVRCLCFKMMYYGGAPDIAGLLFKAEERLNRFLKLDKELIEA